MCKEPDLKPYVPDYDQQTTATLQRLLALDGGNFVRAPQPTFKRVLTIHRGRGK